MSATIQRRPDEVLAFFRGCLKRTIAVIPADAAVAGCCRWRATTMIPSRHISRCVWLIWPILISGSGNITA